MFADVAWVLEETRPVGEVAAGEVGVVPADGVFAAEVVGVAAGEVVVPCWAGGDFAGAGFVEVGGDAVAVDLFEGFDPEEIVCEGGWVGESAPAEGGILPIGGVEGGFEALDVVLEP